MNAVATSPLVGIVIVNYNGTSDTIECLRSLMQLQYERFRVYVVDNGSSEACGPIVKAMYPEAKVVELRPNRGFAAGANAGIREGLADGADYIWLLNNDTVVDPRSLAELVRVAESQPCYGIVGSKILRYDDRAVIDHAGGRVYPWLGLALHRGKGRVDRGQYDSVEVVDYVTGASLLAKRAVLEDVGLLPEHYFLYYEETEWCLRARNRGWKVVYAPGSAVYHKIGSSVGRTPISATYYFARIFLFFVQRTYPHLMPLALIWWPARFLVRNLVRLRFRHVGAALWALRDAVYQIMSQDPARSFHADEKARP